MIIFRSQVLLIIGFSFRHEDLLATDGFAFVALGHGDGRSQAQAALAGQIGHLAGGQLVMGRPMARLLSNSVLGHGKLFQVDFFITKWLRSKTLDE